MYRWFETQLHTLATHAVPNVESVYVCVCVPKPVTLLLGVDCRHFPVFVMSHSLRSSKAPDAHADMGTHHFTYALMPHEG